MPTALSDVRFWGAGKHLLAASISPFDPERTLAQGELTSTSLARASAKWTPVRPQEQTPFLGWRPAASNRISHSCVLREPYSAGTFKKSAPTTSAIVWC